MYLEATVTMLYHCAIASFYLIMYEGTLPLAHWKHSRNNVRFSLFSCLIDVCTVFFCLRFTYLNYSIVKASLTSTFP